jgi:hypothetical protein
LENAIDRRAYCGLKHRAAEEICVPCNMLMFLNPAGGGGGLDNRRSFVYYENGSESRYCYAYDRSVCIQLCIVA